MGKNIGAGRLPRLSRLALAFSLLLLAACAGPGARRSVTTQAPPPSTPPPDCAALVQPAGDPRFPLVRFDRDNGTTIYERGLALRDGRHVLVSRAGIDRASGITVLRDGQVPVATKVVAQDGFWGLMVVEAAEDAAVPFRGAASTPQVGDTLQLMTTRSTQQLLTLPLGAVDRDVKSPLLMNVSVERRCGLTPGPVLAQDGSLAGWMQILEVDKKSKEVVADGPVVLHLADELLDHGWVRRAHFGVIGQNMTPALAAAFHADSADGVIVSKFDAGSVAFAAGMRAEDIIVAVDDTPVRDMHDMQSASALKRPGERAVLHLLRYSAATRKLEPMALEMTLPEHGAQAEPPPPPAAETRTLAEVQEVFDRNRGPLTAIYLKRTHDNPKIGAGRIEVSLGVAPDGSVTHCEIVSSSFNDGELEQKIVQRILLLRFQARAVPPYELAKYPIQFVPM